MAQASSDGTQVDSSAQELGRRVVPEPADCRVDPHAIDHLLIPLDNRIRRNEGAAVRDIGEDVCILGKLSSERNCSLGATLVVRAEHGDSLVVDDNASLLMRLRILLDQVAEGVLAYSALDLDDASGEVDPVPPQRAKLSASAPVFIFVQIKAPQSGSLRAASRTIRAASVGDGGSGLTDGLPGLMADLHGLTLIQSHRTPASNAALRLQWIFKIVRSASGRQRCGWHIRLHALQLRGFAGLQAGPTCSSHSCGRDVRCWTNFLPSQ